MKHIKLFVLFLILFAFTESVFADKETEVYVSNNRIGIAVAVKGSGFYISVELLKQATKGDIQIDESTGQIKIKGKIIEKNAILFNKKWVVPVEEVGRGLGYEYRYDSSTNMIDLFKRSAHILNSSNQQSSTPYDPYLDEKTRSRYINKAAPGQTIDIKQHIIPERINIFCFYSDY